MESKDQNIELPVTGENFNSVPPNPEPKQQEIKEETKYEDNLTEQRLLIENKTQNFNDDFDNLKLDVEKGYLVDEDHFDSLIIYHLMRNYH